MTFIFDEKQKKAVDKLTKKTNNKVAEAVEQIIWNLTVKELAYLQIMNSEVFGTKPTDYKEAHEFCLALRNTIFNEYVKTHPTFMFGRINTNFAVDDFASCKVYSKIAEFVSTASVDQIERTDFLLRSPEERLRFGGIRSLGFTCDEASYVMANFSIESLSSMLSQAIGSEAKKSVENLEKSKTQKAAPNIESVGNIQKSNTKVKEDTSALEDNNEKVEEKDCKNEAALTPYVILKNRDLIARIIELDEKVSHLFGVSIKDFFDGKSDVVHLLMEIDTAEKGANELGFSVTDVIVNKEKIENIFVAVDQLD